MPWTALARASCQEDFQTLERRCSAALKSRRPARLHRTGTGVATLRRLADGTAADGGYYAHKTRASQRQAGRAPCVSCRSGEPGRRLLGGSALAPAPPAILVLDLRQCTEVGGGVSAKDGPHQRRPAHPPPPAQPFCTNPTDPPRNTYHRPSIQRPAAVHRLNRSPSLHCDRDAQLSHTGYPGFRSDARPPSLLLTPSQPEYNGQSVCLRIITYTTRDPQRQHTLTPWLPPSILR